MQVEIVCNCEIKLYYHCFSAFICVFVYCQCLLVHTGFLIRLVGGSTYNEGRVEVNYNGEWGTVCDNGWDYTEASVVCRQLGFGYYSGFAYESTFFGQGSGSILLNNINCNGYESTLASCSHAFGSTEKCSHSEDAGVICSSYQGTYNYVRICN